MANVAVSKNYSSIGSSIINTIKSALPIVCGVPDSVLSGLNKDRYCVTIHSSLQEGFLGLKNRAQSFTIRAYLQEKVVISVSSEWESISQMFGGDLLQYGSAISEAITNRSLISKASTRRRWSGSSPLNINLKLKFEAINDIMSEVIQPCVGLQGLVLPRGGFLDNFFLIPPGPSPFNLPTDKTGNQAYGVRGEGIDINIGNFINFSSVIVENVKVTFENRMSENGPIGAEAEVNISTYEMLTKEGLEQAYFNVVSLQNLETSVSGGGNG